MKKVGGMKQPTVHNFLPRFLNGLGIPLMGSLRIGIGSVLGKSCMQK